MDFNGNDTTTSVGGGDASFTNICTSTLSSERINVGLCSGIPYYTLPLITPPSGNPGARVVMTAQSSGSTFRIPISTFRWLLQTSNGNYYNINVPIPAGDYNIITDIFPLIEMEFQDILAPLTASGDITCTMNGNYFNLTLSNSNLIVLIRQYDDGVAPSNYYLGSQSGQSEIFADGTIQPPEPVVFTAVSNPIMNWEPYSLVDSPGVQNPMDSNLDANNFAIKNLSTINLDEQKTPPTPPAPGSVSLWIDNTNYLNTIDSTGAIITLRQDQISSLDDSTLITCNPAGIINYEAAVNDFSQPPGTFVVLPTLVSVPTGTTFNMAGAAFLYMDSTPQLNYSDTVSRFNINSTNSDLVAPNGVDMLSIVNGGATFANNLPVSGGGPLSFPSFDIAGLLKIGDVNASVVILGRSNQTGISYVNSTLFQHQSRPVSSGWFSSQGNDTLSTLNTELPMYNLINLTGIDTITANYLRAGTTFSFLFGGVIAKGGGAASIRIRIRGTSGGITGAVLFDTGVMSTNNGNWSLSGNLLSRTTGIAGVAANNANAIFVNGTTVISTDYQNTTTFDTTVNNTISITTLFTGSTSTVSRRIGSFTQVYY